MVKESGKRCSCCGNNGHNARTCNGKGCLKLFGVRIVPMENQNQTQNQNHENNEKKVNEEETMRKSKSMGNLELFAGEGLSGEASGYLSDGPVHTGKRKADAMERRKGVPWSKGEHLTFLAGLEKLGKGDWKGISKNYVTTRTPTQVASHAQKYFNRLNASEKRRRRPSLFDMPLNENEEANQVLGARLTDNPEVPREVCTSSNGTPKKSRETPSLVSVSTRAVNLFPSSSCSEATPSNAMAAACEVPNFPGILAFPISNESSAAKMTPATIQFLPMMNFPGQGYVCIPQSQGNFATCAPIASTSPGCLPQPFPHGFTLGAPGAPTIG